jgi:hypothetical protein
VERPARQQQLVRLAWELQRLVQAQVLPRRVPVVLGLPRLLVARALARRL